MPFCGKRIGVLALALVVLAFVSFRALYGHAEYVRGLERFHVHELARWASTQRGFAHRLDRAVAEVLAAPDPASLRQALERAHEAAYSGREALWSPAPIGDLNSYLNRWNYSRAYQDAGSYLHYLADSDADLGPVEVGHLELIREYADIIYDAFCILLSHVRYEEISGDGRRTVIRHHSWRDILGHDCLARALDGAGMEMSLLQAVGGGDPSYRAYLDSRRSASDLPWGLAQSGERAHSEGEMLLAAQEFVASFGSGRVAPAGAPPTPGGPETWTVGRGGGSGTALEPEHVRFALVDEDTGWRYEVDVTAIGGHIFHLRALAGDEGPSMATLEEAALALVSHWADAEGVILEPVWVEIDQDEIHWTHGQVIDGIFSRDSVVHTMAVMRGRGMDITMDASRYFYRYGWSPDQAPEISSEEALGLLNPRLTADGQPRLETRGEAIVYAVPVRGVDRIQTVYINAVTGEHEGVAYSRVSSGE